MYKRCLFSELPDGPVLHIPMVGLLWNDVEFIKKNCFNYNNYGAGIFPV